MTTGRGSIDWASAEVRSARLSLPLLGQPSTAWTERLAVIVAELAQDDDAWDRITVEPRRVVVEPVRLGIAPDLHRRLEFAVKRTNAWVAEPLADPRVAEPPADPPRRRGRLETWGSAGAWASLILLAVLAVVVQRLDWAEPVRATIVVAFITLGPGYALLRPFGLTGGWIGLGLVIALSLSLAMVVAAAMIYAGAWSPFACTIILAGVSVLASLACIARGWPVWSASRENG